MVETYVHYPDIQNPAQQLYPELSDSDAYLALYRDMFVPIIDKLGAITDVACDAGEVMAIICGNPGAAALFHAGRLTKDRLRVIMESINASKPASQPLINNITAEASTNLAQRSTRMVEDLASATPGLSKPVAHGVETAAAGANLSDEKVTKIQGPAA